MDQQRPTTFPILKNSMILKCMEEIEIPLTENELTEPGRHKERIKEILIQLVSLFVIWHWLDDIRWRHAG